ncbi:MAG: methyltransferase domain-containing protein, partial [Planctomycetes bacterium]|nr:methyltransferase domain-containing protein [Planctomycetota bacterium]
MNLACPWTLLLSAALALMAQPAYAETAAPSLLADAALPGGLCVHLGCGDGAMTAALRGDGRFLVHGLDADPARVDQARRFLQSRGVYGQAWVEVLDGSRLPYAENLVNLLVVDAAAAPATPLADIARVVCPNGVVYVGADAPAAGNAAADAVIGRMEQAGMRGSEVVRLGGTWVRWRKPWPADMDEWGHPRHGPDGNAASGDRLVGPPRRIRWVAGPMHEASNAVTAGGRFFHAGLIARDAFNGLRLWQKPIEPAPLRLGYPATAAAGSVLPVAAGDRVYVVHAGKLEALDAATGLSVRVYGKAGSTRHILCAGGMLVAVGADSVRAFDAAGGALRWT